MVPALGARWRMGRLGNLNTVDADAPDLKFLALGRPEDEPVEVGDRRADEDPSGATSAATTTLGLGDST